MSEFPQGEERAAFTDPQIDHELNTHGIKRGQLTFFHGRILYGVFYCLFLSIIMKSPITSRFALPIVTAITLFAVIAPVAHGAIRAVGKHKGDYLPAHNFKIEIDGVISGGFKEISGLESEIEVIEFQNGDDPLIRKRPGRVKYSNIVLKRGLMDEADELRQWYKQVLAGKTERKSGSIIYLDRAGAEVLRYKFFEAWPCKWSLPELDNEGGKVAIEKIEICVEKIERL